MKDIKVVFTRHGDGTYIVTMLADNVSIGMHSHCYNHCPGNHCSLTFQGVSKENILELAEKIRDGAENLM